MRAFLKCTADSRLNKVDGGVPVDGEGAFQGTLAAGSVCKSHQGVSRVLFIVYTYVDLGTYPGTYLYT